MLIISKNSLTATPRLLFDQTVAYHRFAKLTQKINDHTFLSIYIFNLDLSFHHLMLEIIETYPPPPQASLPPPSFSILPFSFPRILFPWSFPLSYPAYQIILISIYSLILPSLHSWLSSHSSPRVAQFVLVML